MTISRSVFLSALLAVGRFTEAKQLINNVYYCNEIDRIQYQNVGCEGTFQTPSYMEDGTCSVSRETRSYSGPLAPLNEELTIHLRGPLNLYKFAAYMPSPDEEDEDDEYEEVPLPESYAKRDEHLHRRHDHAHIHEKRKNAGKVKTETKIVDKTVTITHYADATLSGLDYAATGAVVANAKSDKKKGKKGKKSEWKRVGYYNAKKQIRDGIMFLNNKGGQGSGKWSSCFGNSLAYMSADGKSGSATPQTLADGVTFGVNEEFSIWTNQTCAGTSGYSYAPDVCYRGFAGDNKIFTFEFMMPTDTKNAGNIYGNSNMPAIWSLNSLIGRTQQYPSNKDNSCWDSGCGEFDIFEVLHWDYPASQYMTSTLHTRQGAGENGKGGGGTCDYFKRPTDFIMKGMVSYTSDGTITIMKLDDDFKFPKYLTNKFIKKNVTPDMPSFRIKDN